MSSYFVTTPIYYVNGSPHLGHLYTTLIADTLSVYHRQRGDDVFFLTGTDEHGRNVERAAEKAGVPTQQYVDANAAQFETMVADFGLQPSRFIRTTAQSHKQGAVKLFDTLVQNGHIYKGHYDGLYCVGCNQFYTETEAELQNGEKLCPTHGTPLERVREESYFFRLSEFQQPLLDLYAKQPEFVRPEARLREVVSFVSGGLTDLSVSRTAVRWGIPLPSDPQHTLYVWLDALSNYITALGYGNQEFDGFDRYWPATQHLVGKDILRFHAVYWPAFLLAAGLPLPKQIVAHGMWVSGGRKMSKSLGNVIDIAALRRHFSLDAIRYFSLREKAFGDDADFNYPAFLRRYNGDLASGLGNLASRSLALVKSGLGGEIPAVPAQPTDAAVNAVKDMLLQAQQRFTEEFERMEFNRALEALWRAISETDGYIATKEPWALAKDPTRRPELETVLGTACEVLRFLAVLLFPVQPNSMLLLWAQLGLPGTPANLNPATLQWGQEAARALGTLGPLYPRYDEAKVLAKLAEEGEYKPELAPEATPGNDTKGTKPGKAATKNEKKEAKPVEAKSEDTQTNAAANVVELINFDDFAKVQLRTGIVLTAVAVPKADKLLKLEVDTGDGAPRTIVSGIAQAISPEALIGMSIVVVVNLAPRKLKGIESQGMLLAASLPDGSLKLVTLAEGVPAGCRVS